LLAASNGITFRYSLWLTVSHVYSTYTMSPSALMSPNSFSTVALDPLTMPVGGTTPVANAPRGCSTVPAACAFVKHAVSVLLPLLWWTAATRNVSCESPSSVVSMTYEIAGTSAHMPAIEFTPTTTEFTNGVAGSQVI